MKKISKLLVVGVLLLSLVGCGCMKKTERREQAIPSVRALTSAR